MKILLANPPWSVGSCRAGSRWAHGAEGAGRKIGFLDRVIERLEHWGVQEKSDTYHNFPYFLAYSAAVLEQEAFEVRVIDSLALEQSENEFLEDVKLFNPDIIVFETSTPSFNNDVNILGKIKNSCNCRTVMCGTHPTSLPNETLSHNVCDFVVLGEYEIVLRNLIKSVEGGGDLSKIKGIAYKMEGEIKINQMEGLVELDDLPLPAYHLMPMEKYYTPVPGAKSAIEVLSSRGCPFNCSYCIFPQLLYKSQKMRYRNPARVVDEIELLVREYGLDGIFFDDDTFTTNQEHVTAVCDELVNRNIDVKWSCFGRVDTVNKEMLMAMKNAGCTQVRYGVESGSQKVLDEVNKGFTVEQVKDAFRITKNVGLSAHATLMVGLPGETAGTIEETLKLAKEIDADSSVWALLTPFPGTKIYEEAKSQGYIMLDDWDKYDGYNHAIMRTQEMSVEKIEKAYDDIQRRWRIYIRGKPKTIAHFIRTAYRNGGVLNLFRVSIIKSLEVLRDLS